MPKKRPKICGTHYGVIAAKIYLYHISKNTSSRPPLGPISELHFCPELQWFLSWLTTGLIYNDVGWLRLKPHDEQYGEISICAKLAATLM